MIKFTKLTVEGFGSLIDKKEFSLDLPGLNIIRGKVGSGKTSIPSVMYWVIYGSSLKKGSTIETWDELRTDKFKGTFGKLDFKIGPDKYSIIRCIQYKGVVFEKQKGGSKIMVIKNGQEQKSDAKGKKGIQALIESIIGYSPELFINSIIYGQRLKRIIEESGPNKKKIFDEAFETMFIDKAKNKVGEELKNLNSLAKDIINNKDNLKEQMRDNQDSFNSLSEMEKNFAKDKNKKIKELRNELAYIEMEKIKASNQLKECDNSGRKSDLSKKIESLEELKEKANEKISKDNKLRLNLDKIKESILTLKEQGKNIKAKKCFTCGGILNSDKVKALTESNNEKLEGLLTERDAINTRIRQLNIEKVNKELEKIKKKLSSCKSKYQEIISNEKAKSILEANIISFDKKLKAIKIKLKETRASTIKITSVKYKNKVYEIEKQIITLDKELDKVNQSIGLNNWLVKEPLSNSGIKAYIFDSLLSRVNDNLTNYSEILGFRVEFGIDMGTAAKDFYQVIYKDDILINYPDLSGGQKQLVDTAVALAIHDVISSVKPINILFLDEPFEGLDADTIEIVSDIISYKAINRSLFLITHHPSFNPTNSNTIYFSLDKNGNTKID